MHPMRGAVADARADQSLPRPCFNLTYPMRGATLRTLQKAGRAGYISI